MAEMEEGEEKAAWRFEEHFDIDDSWNDDGIVWENESDQCPLVVGYVPVVEEE